MGDPGGSDDDTVLTLPDAERSAFKDPFGPVYTDPAALYETVDGPLITVGDIVTAAFLDRGITPDIAIVDGYTERERIDQETVTTLERIEAGRSARNPAGTITRSMIDAIVEALDEPGATRIDVEGEEDLAVVPAVLAAPNGATVVYGQPGEGMVAVAVDDETKSAFDAMLDRFEGSPATARELVSTGEDG